MVGCNWIYWTKLLRLIDWLIGCYMSSFAQPRPSRECLGPRAKGDLSPSSNSANNDTQTKSITVCHKQGIKIELMNCDLENSFLLVYLSGPLITTHGPRGAAPAYPPPLSVGLCPAISMRWWYPLSTRSTRLVGYLKFKLAETTFRE
jgi:hypothetical protein